MTPVVDLTVLENGAIKISYTGPDGDGTRIKSISGRGATVDWTEGRVLIDGYGILDFNPANVNLTISGSPVSGTLEEISAIVATTIFPPPPPEE